MTHPFAVYKRLIGTYRYIQTESERMEYQLTCQWTSKESWGGKFHIRRLDFKLKTVVRDTEGHYIILKGCIQQVDMTIINIYAPNRGATRYTSQLLTKIKRHIYKNTLIVGDLNTPLSAIDRSPKQKINKETRALNDIMETRWTS